MRPACPASRSILSRKTPTKAPATPPAINTAPMRKSILLRRHWASAPDTEVATIWLAPVATAIEAGMPENIRKGVSRNPPPTPNMPDRKPTAAPSPSITTRFTEISAMGR